MGLTSLYILRIRVTSVKQSIVVLSNQRHTNRIKKKKKIGKGQIDRH